MKNVPCTEIDTALESDILATHISHIFSIHVHVHVYHPTPIQYTCSETAHG